MNLDTSVCAIDIYSNPPSAISMELETSQEMHCGGNTMSDQRLLTLQSPHGDNPERKLWCGMATSTLHEIISCHQICTITNPVLMSADSSDAFQEAVYVVVYSNCNTIWASCAILIN